MGKKISLIFFFYLLIILCFSCDSFYYVYVDDKTLERQLSYLNNGFVEIILEIDPTKNKLSENYVTPGQIRKEVILKNKTITSSELVQLILNVYNENRRYSNKYFPTYDIYIKYTDKILFFIPKKKYMAVLLDFTNFVLSIEGRELSFNEQEAKLFKEKLDNLLKMGQEK